MRYRSHKRGKIAPASYPTINPTQTITGLVQDLVHERGESTILGAVRFITENNNPVRGIGFLLFNIL